MQPVFLMLRSVLIIHLLINMHIFWVALIRYDYESYYSQDPEVKKNIRYLLIKRLLINVHMRVNHNCATAHYYI